MNQLNKLTLKKDNASLERSNPEIINANEINRNETITQVSNSASPLHNSPK